MDAQTAPSPAQDSPNFHTPPPTSLSISPPPPQILRRTAGTQVNQLELPCPSFADLIKNGRAFMPNEWTISLLPDAVGDACFLAHVVDSTFRSPSVCSPPLLPRCDRAIYLTLEGQSDESGMIFDCQELFLHQGIVQKKSYETTVEFLGDLLALLFSQPGEDEGDGDVGDRRDEGDGGEGQE